MFKNVLLGYCSIKIIQGVQKTILMHCPDTLNTKEITKILPFLFSLDAL